MSSPVLSVSANRLRVGRWMGLLIDACIGLVIVLVPGLAATSFEQGELYKQALLIGLVTIAVTASCVKAALERRAEIAFGWLHVVLVTFGLAALLSSITSLHSYVSFIGEGGQRAWAWSSLAALIAFVLLLAQRMRTAAQAYNALFLLFVGGIGLAGGGLWSIVRREPMNAAGSVYALVVALAPLVVMSVGLMFQGMRGGASLFSLPVGAGRIARLSAWIVFLLALVVLLAVNFWLGWVMLLIGLGVVVGIGVGMKTSAPRLMRWGIVTMCGLFAVGLLAFSAPWKFVFPGEVALSQRASWEIAQQGLAAHPLLGSGLGTWMYNHAAYRARIINLSPFWATSFDRGISLILTLLVTTGMLGTLAFLALIVGISIVSLRMLLRARMSVSRGAVQDEMGHILLILFAGWASLVLSSVFYTFNFAHQLLFWTLTGCLLGLLVRRRFVFEAVRPTEALVLTARAAIVGIIAIAVFTLGGQALWAQMRLQQVVHKYAAGSLSVDEVIKRLEDVRAVHPWNDVSARTLSQAYLIRVLQRIKDKPPTEQARLVGDDVTHMVDAALEAVSRGPAQPENWANAGLIYASIAPFTRGADEFALKHYQEAMQRDPQSPFYPTEIGRVYLLRADALRPLTEAKDPQAARAAKDDEQKVLKAALSSLQGALVLKEDYVPARYYLAVVLDRQGNTAAAVKELERVVVQERTPDRVFELGVLYARVGDRAKAIAAFEEVLRADHSQMKARWQLASLYEEVGRLSEALAQLRVVAGSAPTNAALQKRLQTLEARVKPAQTK